MNSSDSVKPVRVNYDYSTAKVSQKETIAEGRLMLDIKNKQGKSFIVPFYEVILSVGKEIQKARSEAKLGKAQKLIHQFEILKTESAPLFKESDSEFGFKTKGYEFADGWITHLKTQLQSQSETIKEEAESFEASVKEEAEIFEADVKEESELLETREDYVDSLAHDFREYVEIKDKIILKRNQIRFVQSNYPDEKRLIKKLKRQLIDLKSDFSFVLEFISITRRSFEDNTKNLPLGDWKNLLFDAFKGIELTRDQKINFFEMFRQK